MLITANNVVGGGDSWVVDSNGIPVVHELTTGVNTVTFTLPNLNYAYCPYINSADGTEPPKYTSCTNTGNICTVVTTAVTTDQQGSGGHDCYLMMRIIK